MFSSIGLAQAETGIVTSIYLSISMMLGGIFNRSLPSWISWYRYINPIFQGYSITLSMQLNAFGGIK